MPQEGAPAMPDTTTTGTGTVSPAGADMPARVAVRDLPALLTGGATVTLMVSDFGDPCGIRKIARRVEAAYRHDTPDGRGGWTSERWMLVFAGRYVYPMLLVTYGDAVTFETTDREPDVSGPCDGCRAYAASLTATDHRV
jgi:hypothetical protein